MKLKRFLKILFIISIIEGSIFFTSCSDDSNPAAPTPPNTAGLFKLDSVFAIGGRSSVSVYLEDSLHTGYNRIYLILYDSVTNALITDAHIQFSLLNHGHYSPVENPDENAPDGIFKGAWILNASQSDFIQHWQYSIIVHNHQAQGEPTGTASLSDFSVKDTPDKFKSIIMPDSTPLYISFIKPENPAAGMNDFEFIINKNEPELFPPDGSYIVQMQPEFLSNGHTTSGNINPAGDAAGHYKGKVNFDVSGAWRIKLNISKNGLSYDTFFDILF